MVEVVCLTLDNEMDLILSHKKASRLAEKLQLAISTQSTFATAVAEVCREVIERTDQGELGMGLRQEGSRYSLVARIKFPGDVIVDKRDEGLLYAQKLVPRLDVSSSGDTNVIEISIGLPRSAKIDPVKITALTHFFKHEEPYSPYEEVKIKNRELLNIAEERYEELLQSKIINDKKNEFISIASHELKTPVTIIKAFSQIALAASGEDKCSDKVTGYLNRIESQATRLQLLIQQLMDVSRIENGAVEYKLETVNLNKYLDDTLTLIRHAIPTHRVNLKLDEGVVVNIDKSKLEQVLSNILGNAAKYSPNSPLIELSTTNKNKNVIVSIRDYGIGMSPANLSRVFEKFYRNAEVTKKYSGMGMGLYITSNIVKGHGGKIWAESKEGEGTSIHFSLPVMSEN